MSAHSNFPTPITIGGTEIQQITYKGEPVVTFAMVDEVHQRPDGTAKRNFDENRTRFVPGEDFIEIGSDEIRTNLPEGVFSKFAPKGMLLTKRGYLKLVKPMSDDRAWQVQGEMIDAYFAVRQQRALTPAEMFLQSAQVMADLERRQFEHEARLTAIDSKVETIEAAQSVMSARPANAEAMTHLRKRIGKMFGLSAKIVDEVMRQSPYAPKPAGMVRNEHVDADGSTYAVYWKKDVTATFDRFASECQPASAVFYTHPFVQGRFRLARSSA
jgi:hypothetical protein